MAKFTMYLLVILFRMLLGRDDAGTWCFQLVRRDGRSETRPWSGLFMNFFADCWADFSWRTCGRSDTSHPNRDNERDKGRGGGQGSDRNSGHAVNRGTARVRARIASLRRRPG